MDRPTKPYAQVKDMLGKASAPWEKITGLIRYHYMMDEKWEEGNLNHKHHSNLYFRRGGKTLTTLCIREGYFLICVVLGKAEREKFDAQRTDFGQAVCTVYDSAEVLHDGKWLGFEVHGEDDLPLIDDIVKLLYIKRKPNRKVFPENMEACGVLDIGLSHEDVTNLIV